MIGNPRRQSATRQPLGLGDFLFDAISIVTLCCYGFVPRDHADAPGQLALAFVMIDPIVQFGALYPLMAALRNRERVGPIMLYSAMLSATLLWGWYRILPEGHALQAVAIVAWVVLGRAHAFVTKMRSTSAATLVRTVLPPAITTIVSFAVAATAGISAAMHAAADSGNPIDPMLLVALAYYATHALLSLPMPQRWMQERCGQAG